MTEAFRLREDPVKSISQHPSVQPSALSSSQMSLSLALSCEKLSKTGGVETAWWSKPVIGSPREQKHDVAELFASICFSHDNQLRSQRTRM